MHVCTPRRPDRVHAAHPPHDGLPIEGHVLTERRIVPHQVVGDRPGSGCLSQPRRQLGCKHALNRDGRRRFWNAAQPLHEEAFRRKEPIAQRLVGGPGRLIRLTRADHRAHKKSPSRVPSRDRIHLPGVDIMGNPFLLAIVARIFPRSVSHQPQRPDAACFVRKCAALAGAVPAHEHLDREVHLPGHAVHGGRHLLLPRRDIAATRPVLVLLPPTVTALSASRVVVPIAPAVPPPNAADLHALQAQPS